MKQIDFTDIEKEPIQNHTSKGNQPKWHVRDKWYKADHMGYEALAEYAVSKLLEKSNVGDFVDYDLVKIKYDGKEDVGCVSTDFKAKDEMLIPLEKLHRIYFGRGLADALAKQGNAFERIAYTVDFVEEVTGLCNVGKYFAVMTAVDAFFLNEDRHTNNIAVIRNEKTKTFRMAPVFDNGLALLSDINDYPLEKDVYECIDSVLAKPFDTSFDVQLDAAEELYGSQLKLTFTREDVYALFDKLNGVYDSRAVYRAQRVLLEQMRKYSVLF